MSIEIEIEISAIRDIGDARPSKIHMSRPATTPL